MEKISRIRDSLQVHTIYDPQTTFMCTFEQVTEKEVAKCIGEMASKSCELDAVPTTTFKQVLDTIIALITRTVNVSLGSGIVASQWKTAIVILFLRKQV